MQILSFRPLRRPNTYSVTRFSPGPKARIATVVCEPDTNTITPTPGYDITGDERRGIEAFKPAH